MDHDTLEWLMWFQSEFLHLRPGRVGNYGRYTTSDTGHPYECTWEADGDDHMLKLTNLVTTATAGVRVHDTKNIDNPAPGLQDLIKVWRLVNDPSRNASVFTARALLGQGFSQALGRHFRHIAKMATAIASTTAPTTSKAGSGLAVLAISPLVVETL